MAKLNVGVVGIDVGTTTLDLLAKTVPFVAENVGNSTNWKLAKPDSSISTSRTLDTLKLRVHRTCTNVLAGKPHGLVGTICDLSI